MADEFQTTIYIRSLLEKLFLTVGKIWDFFQVAIIWRKKQGSEKKICENENKRNFINCRYFNGEEVNFFTWSKNFLSHEKISLVTFGLTFHQVCFYSSSIRKRFFLSKRLRKEVKRDVKLEKPRKEARSRVRKDWSSN